MSPQSDEMRAAAFVEGLSSESARRLYTALDRFGGYWRDYDFTDFEDLRGLRDTLQDLAFEAHAAITELEADRG